MNNSFELTQNNGIINESVSDGIFVSRQALLDEHAYLVSRLQQLRRLLNLEPLPTGKQQRREARQ